MTTIEVDTTTLRVLVAAAKCIGMLEGLLAHDLASVVPLETLRDARKHLAEYDRAIEKRRAAVLGAQREEEAKQAGLRG